MPAELRTSPFFFLAAIPKRSHPFPSRTRKLSSSGPMVLQGQLCGRVGRCRGFEGPLARVGLLLFRPREISALGRHSSRVGTVAMGSLRPGSSIARWSWVPPGSNPRRISTAAEQSVPAGCAADGRTFASGGSIVRAMKHTSLLVFLGIMLAAGVARGQQQDFSKVTIKTTKLTDSIYMLEGSGGNIGVSIGEDGVILIDDQFAPLTGKIQEAVAKLT